MPTDFADLFAAGYRARQDGDSAHSRAIFLDATRRAAEQCDEPSLAEALSGLARAERDIGNCPAALHHYTNAVALYRRIGPPTRLAHALRHQADLLRQTPQASEAEPLYREAEVIYRQAGAPDALHLANTLRGLALLEGATVSPAAARPLWQEARTLYAACDIQPGIAECDRMLSLPS